MASQTILVAGDLVYCYHLAPLPGIHHPARTQVHHEAGGAYYLAALLEKVAGSAAVIGPKAVGKDAREATPAYFHWQAFEAGKDKKVWRVRTAEIAQNGESIEQLHDAVLSPDVLVLDDGNLGFRDQRGIWPRALSGSTAKHIVLKTTRPVAEGPLWQHLRDSKLLSKVTVVISAENIRSRGASLSRALSWDAAIEDIVAEMRDDYSSRDLAKCARTVIYFGTAGVAWFDGGEWQRLVFDPKHLEGTWEESRPGRLIGAASTIACAVALHQLNPESTSLFANLSCALASLRESHEAGAGEFPKEFKLNNHIEFIAAKLSNPAPVDGWMAAFRPGAKGTLKPASLEDGGSDLLSSACGPDYEYLAAIAMDVVMRGLDAALPQVPRAQYEKYLTVDREEIEGINGIRALIQNYRSNHRDPRPLSIAVFGPPGSGKSFAIKQLAAAMQPKDTPYEFNLSQFRDEADLEEALHHVRDASVGNKIPLVFWDEFDTGDLRWLKAFLAPMQDSQFHSRGSVYPLGRAIFVFAGGTRFDFSSFDRSGELDFRDKKGNDFVSRLRGYLNIKGPNRLNPLDHAHLLRRATLLRSSLERFHPQLIDPLNKRAQIQESIVRAYLRVEEYKHGARSLETLVVMSREVADRPLAPADLPERRVLDIHVSRDFLDHVTRAEVVLPAIEQFAIKLHDGWYEEKKNRTPPGSPPASELEAPYESLSDDNKAKAIARNWRTASLLEAKLHRAGLRIAPIKDESVQRAPLTEETIEFLALLEHDIWLRDRLLNGWAYGSGRVEALRLHPGLLSFSRIAESDRELNRVLARKIEDILAKAGCQLVRRD